MAEQPHQIFISYSRQDLIWARAFAAALRDRRWSVFLDEEMKPGVEWSPEIDAAVDAAKVVIVIWSARAKRSSYVISESTRAVVRGTLVPVRMERCDPPKVFARFQVEDMSVSGAGNLPPSLISTIETRLAAPAQANAEEQRFRAEMAQTAELSRERGVPLLALQMQLERLGEVDIAPEHVPARIETFVTNYLKLKADLERATNADPEIAATHGRALDLLNTGDLDEARKLFDGALTRLRERQRQTSRETTTLLADRARLDVLQLRYADAVAAYEEAADLMRFDAEATLGHLKSLTGVLIKQGEEFGDNAALQRAIEVIRARALPLVPRVSSPLDWARLQDLLGVALRVLGEREHGYRTLMEAVEAFSAALGERSRERVPLDWATTQNNLGLALVSLGPRWGGKKFRLEAVKAFRAALQERTRENSPLDWATTQNNLGSALQGLAEEEIGTDRLKEAVAAYQAALQELSRDRAPLEWGMAHSSLGFALYHRGVREQSIARLEEAEAAFRAALQVYTRERLPLAWARAQWGLGEALGALGESEASRQRLEESVAAFHAALEEFTPERAPYYHSKVDDRLFVALARLARPVRSCV